MEFEWDSKKAKTNLKKHGVDFDEAATTFFDPDGIDFFDEKHSGPKESRFIRLALSSLERILMVVYTERTKKRSKKKMVRLISSRKASQKERKLYYGKTIK